MTCLGSSDQYLLENEVYGATVWRGLIGAESNTARHMASSDEGASGARGGSDARSEAIVRG